MFPNRSHNNFAFGQMAASIHVVCTAKRRPTQIIRMKMYARSLDTMSRNDSVLQHLSARSVQPHSRKFSYAPNRQPISPIAFPTSALAHSQTEAITSPRRSKPTGTPSPPPRSPTSSTAGADSSSSCLSPMGSILTISPAHVSPRSRTCGSQSHDNEDLRFLAEDDKDLLPPAEDDKDLLLSGEDDKVSLFSAEDESPNNIDSEGFLECGGEKKVAQTNGSDRGNNRMSLEEFDVIDRKLSEIVESPMRKPIYSFPRPLDPPSGAC